MEWEEFWNSLIREHKLTQKVLEMNQVDALKGHPDNIEKICHYIYEDYKVWKCECEAVKKEIWNTIESFGGVHLHTSRIKTQESLIEKVIRKRYEWLGNDYSKYANISVENYRDIITDLVGLRLIINYRGHWLDLHKSIISEFPIDCGSVYKENVLLPHQQGRNIQAELPKVYYAEGDDTQEYIAAGLIVKQHKKNYRSVHYTVSFHGVYIEIQVRTIYDEAWSDCDHSYVYKEDANRSHTALEQLSGILAKLTNLSNDIGEWMKDIYDSEAILDNQEKGWKTSADEINKLNKMLDRMNAVENDLRNFKNKMTIIETFE